MKNMNIKQFTPHSLAARTSLVLIVVIILAQLVAGMIWFQHSAKNEEQGLKSTISNLVLSASSTISFFTTIPVDYRHLILDQLRSMGGTRFFVSLNNRELPVSPIPESPRKQLVLSEARKILNNELGSDKNIKLEFTTREELKVFSAGINIDELPLLWANYSLPFSEVSPPILVIQVEISSNEWFYLAAVLPAPYGSLESSFMDNKQLFFLALSAIILLIFTWLVVRSEIKPIKNLAKAATLMDSKLYIPEVKEEGSSELKAAVHAFNKMNRRVKSHLREREMLFGAISHDLKTPLTKARLLIENQYSDKSVILKYFDDIDYLFSQIAVYNRKSDKNHKPIKTDIVNFVECLCEEYERFDAVDYSTSIERAFVYIQIKEMKRAFSNIIDNAIKYAGFVNISISNKEDFIKVIFTDTGPGINENELNKIWQPFFRSDIARSSTIPGTGLGLCIVKKILEANNAQISIKNNKPHGLKVTVKFQSISDTI